uniref:Nucleolar protein 7 n=1 Tax=Calidris pygmaea TaxID=425635 RepID=A0A8C3KBV3_9CHAR
MEAVGREEGGVWRGGRGVARGVPHGGRKAGSASGAGREGGVRGKMAPRKKAGVAAAARGKRGPPAAHLSPASSEDEAPEEVSFGAAREAAEAERKHRELLKEKRRRRQELFVEQKRRKLLPEAVLQELTAAPPTGGKRELSWLEGKERDTDCCVCCSVTTRQGLPSLALTRPKGNYTAVRLKDQSLTGLHQQLAKDFLNTQLYGPDTNRVQANEFFSLENKKDPVKKAAVQFVDKSWGKYIKSQNHVKTKKPTKINRLGL